ncbi:stage V sporulation protein S [Alphaproteobacteria bacterium]|nr:stage V sporulation protein S [Alphaproteobacteria bacterium]
MVSSNTLPIKTAGAIAGIINDGESSVDVQAIGADAVNRATKAVAIAMGRLKEDGLPTACNIVFQDVVIQGERKTAMRWTVFVI